MSAREEIVRLSKENRSFIDPPCDPETGFFLDDLDAHLAGLLDKYAHELAEEIRGEGMEYDGFPRIQETYGAAADLIEPEVCTHGGEMRCDGCGACHVHESHAEGCAIA